MMRINALLILCLFFSCSGNDSGNSQNNISNFQMETPKANTADALAPYLWYLNNTGQSIFNSNHGVPGADAHLGNAHDFVTGKGVTVVVSDGRIDFSHPDLATNGDLFRSRNYVSNSPPYLGNPNTDDDGDSHGTATSGLIAAEKNNGIGGYGVAPNATIVGFNFISSDQSLAKYIDQFTLTGGEVFNYSYGTSTCFVNPAEGFNEMRSNVISKKNIYVIAGGNDFTDTLENCGGSSTEVYTGNGNLDQIQSNAFAILVGATTASGKIASYSTPSSNNWIAAPGGDSKAGMILNDLAGCNRGWGKSNSPGPFDNDENGLNPFCSYTASFMGTSFSGPVVTGAVALLKEANPNIGWRQIKYILAKTAKKINPTDGNKTHPFGDDLPGHVYSYGWLTNSAGFSFHNLYGFGQLDIESAVNLARNLNFNLFELINSDSLDDKPTYSSGDINVVIPDKSAAGITSSINVDKHNIAIEHVVVTVSIDHPYIGDIGLELVSPHGMKSKLMMINNNILPQNFVDVTFGSNAFYGERSLGSWSLKVVDGAAEDVGKLVSWQISFLGNRGTALADSIAPSPVSGLSAAGNTISFSPSPDADIARYEICISADVCNEGDYRSIQKSNGIAVTNYIQDGFKKRILSGSNYTANVRAVDTSENISPVQTINWTAP
jgi:subtilisin-like proprotein convertase family protein